MVLCAQSSFMFQQLKAWPLTFFEAWKGRDVEKVIITLCTGAIVGEFRCLVAGAASTMGPRAGCKTQRSKSFSLY